MGQPLFHGYYTHHHMTDKYIAWGPLSKGGSPPLFSGQLPSAKIESAGRLSPQQVALIGLFAFACLAVYYWAVMPAISSKYDRASTDVSQKYYFDGLTAAFFLACFVVYHYVIGPGLGINTG